jgi:drug/metabolite transporter (DMT)-like permease
MDDKAMTKEPSAIRRFMSEHVYLILLLLVSFVWGSTFVVIRDSRNYIDPLFLVFSRLLIAALAMMSWCYWRDRVAFFNRTAMRYGALLGFLLFSTYASQTVGLRWTTSGHSGFITGSAVILVPLILRVVFRTPLSRIDYVSSAVVFVGLYLLVYDPGSKINVGDAITLITALSYAVHLIFSARGVKTAPVNGIVAWQFAFSTLFAGVALLLAGGQVATDIERSLLPILYLGLLGTLFCYFVSVWAQQFVSPVTVVIIFSLEAVFAAFLGFIFLSETFSRNEIFGACLIFAGALGHEIHRELARRKRMTVKNGVGSDGSDGC